MTISTEVKRNGKSKRGIMSCLKMLTLTIAITFSIESIFAQATVTSTPIEKENRNAVSVQIDQPVNNTTDALEQRLKRSGLSGKTHSGVTSYKGVTLSEISTEKVDIYTKVEEGSNHGSIVYMAVSKGYDNFTNTASDSMITENVKSFLNSFVKDASNFSADIVISNQLEDLTKDEKDYESLLNDQKDLEKKRSDVENSLKDIQDQLSKKRADIDRKKADLEAMKTKRGGSER